MEGLFCSDRCNLIRGNEALHMVKDAETKAMHDIDRERGGDWMKILQEKLDEAFVEGGDTQKMLKLWAIKAAGHYVPYLAESIMKKFEKIAARRRSPPKEQVKTPPPEEGKASAGAEAGDKTPPPGAASPPKNAVPPKPRVKVAEPANLDDLPLKVQRTWYLKRFTALSPKATVEEIKKEHLRLSKIYHPDRAGTDPRKIRYNSHMMSQLNLTLDKIRDIDKELGKKW